MTEKIEIKLLDLPQVQHLILDMQYAMDAVEAQKNNAYAERNKCVALITRLALALDFPAYRARHVGEEWDDDWRTIIFVDLPAGQVSWHIHDSEAAMFAHLPEAPNNWDGHDTDEKYRRVLAPVEWP